MEVLWDSEVNSYNCNGKIEFSPLSVTSTFYFKNIKIDRLSLWLSQETSFIDRYFHHIYFAKSLDKVNIHYSESF